MTGSSPHTPRRAPARGASDDGVNEKVPAGHLFTPGDVVAAVVEWLAAMADPDGAIRDPQAVAMIQESLTDG